MSNISVLAMIFLGIIIVISILLVLMKRKKNTLIGAWIGFLIPWLYFAYIKTTCIGSHCGHLGMALPSILGYSVLGGLIGGVFGRFFSK